MNIKNALLTGACVGYLFLGASGGGLLGPSVVYAGEGELNIPDVGAPGRRVTGGTRLSDDKQPTLGVLSPVNLGSDGVGSTSQSQPTLYWAFLNAPKSMQQDENLVATFTCVTAEKKLLLQTNVAVNSESGLQAINLADHNVSLQDGMVYEWTIKVVAKDSKQSLIRSGRIKKVALPTQVAHNLADTAPANLPALYVKAGLWYDAVDKLVRLIAINPVNRSLRDYQLALLQQAGLPEFANLDGKSASHI